MRNKNNNNSSKSAMIAAAAAAAAAHSANVGSSSTRERAVRKVGEREREREQMPGWRWPLSPVSPVFLAQQTKSNYNLDKKQQQQQHLQINVRKRKTKTNVQKKLNSANDAVAKQSKAEKNTLQQRCPLPLLSAHAAK